MSNLLDAWNAAVSFLASFPVSAANTVLSVIFIITVLTSIVIVFIRRSDTRMTLMLFCVPIMIYGLAYFFAWVAQIQADPTLDRWMLGLYSVCALLSFILSLFNFVFAWFRRR